MNEWRPNDNGRDISALFAAIDNCRRNPTLFSFLINLNFNFFRIFFMIESKKTAKNYSSGKVLTRTLLGFKFSIRNWKFD